MRRFLSALFVGAILLSTGLALAADAPPATGTPSAVKVKKAYKKAKRPKPAKASTTAPKPF